MRGSSSYPGRGLAARWQAEAAEASPLDPGAYVVEQYRLWREARKREGRESAARRRARAGRISKL